MLVVSAVVPPLVERPGPVEIAGGATGLTLRLQGTGTSSAVVGTGVGAGVGMRRVRPSGPSMAAARSRVLAKVGAVPNAGRLGEGDPRNHFGRADADVGDHHDADGGEALEDGLYGLRLDPRAGLDAADRRDTDAETAREGRSVEAEKRACGMQEPSTGLVVHRSICPADRHAGKAPAALESFTEAERAAA